MFFGEHSGANLRVKPFPKSQLTTFGRNIARLRERANLTQEKVAEKLDISARHFQKLEAGTVSPTFGVLLRLRRALGCTWEELFESLK